jgi:hypothetical protein
MALFFRPWMVSQPRQSMCNMNKSQMRQLRSCLKAELGLSIFSTEYKVQEVLGLEHVEPRTGSYKYGKEKIDWSYKPVHEVLELWLKSRTRCPNGFQCDHLDIVVRIDHGKGHSRIACNFITRRQVETGEGWLEDEHAFTIGNAHCSMRSIRRGPRVRTLHTTRSVYMHTGYFSHFSKVYLINRTRASSSVCRYAHRHPHRRFTFQMTLYC